MKRFSKVAALAAVALVSASLVANGESHAPMLGEEGAEMLMKANGGAMGALSKMAKGEMAYDAAAAEAAKMALITGAQNIPVVFETQFEGDEVKPEIWANWDDFAAKAKALEDAATALDTSSVESIGAGLGAIGGTCQACHQAYKAG